MANTMNNGIEDAIDYTIEALKKLKESFNNTDPVKTINNINENTLYFDGTWSSINDLNGINYYKGIIEESDYAWYIFESVETDNDDINDIYYILIPGKKHDSMYDIIRKKIGNEIVFPSLTSAIKFADSHKNIIV